MNARKPRFLRTADVRALAECDRCLGGLQYLHEALIGPLAVRLHGHQTCEHHVRDGVERTFRPGFSGLDIGPRGTRAPEPTLPPAPPQTEDVPTPADAPDAHWAWRSNSHRHC